MKNLSKLQERALELTKSNIVKKSRSKSMNDRILDILKDGKVVKRIDLVSIITLERLSEMYDEKTLNEKFENLDEEFIKEFNKMNRTCKNGIDTSLADGQNNACFSYNEKYNDYEIIKDGDLISIKLK